MQFKGRRWKSHGKNALKRVISGELLTQYRAASPAGRVLPPDPSTRVPADPLRRPARQTRGTERREEGDGERERVRLANDAADEC